MAVEAGYLGKVVITEGTVGEMMSWAVSGMATEMLDSTAFENTFKNFVPGVGDGGTVTISGNYAKGDTAGDALIAAWQGKTEITEGLKLYYGDGDTDYFELSSGSSAYVESLADLGTDAAGLATISFVLRISNGYLEQKTS